VRVFGEPDGEWGSRVVAEVVLDGVTVEEVRAATRTALSPAQVPRRWVVVEAIANKLT
jgi:acyl-CoA synthetase (AMP-forming)/AMP-acid ligase II